MGTLCNSANLCKTKTKGSDCYDQNPQRVFRDHPLGSFQYIKEEHLKTPTKGRKAKKIKSFGDHPDEYSPFEPKFSSINENDNKSFDPANDIDIVKKDLVSSNDDGKQ
jgi:hypothetical protein